MVEEKFEILRYEMARTSFPPLLEKSLKYESMKWTKLKFFSTIVGEKFEIRKYEMAKIETFFHHGWRKC